MVGSVLGSGLRFEGEGRKDLQVEFLRRHLGGWSHWSVDRGSVLIGDCGEKGKEEELSGKLAAPLPSALCPLRLWHRPTTLQRPNAVSKNSPKHFVLGGQKVLLPRLTSPGQSVGAADCEDGGQACV